MLSLTLVLALQQPALQQSVPDPGVIATNQKISPAGIQTVFTGRPGGVRFGKTSDEIWVAVPGNLYRLQWQSNRVLARAPMPGRPGVYGVAIDPVTRRVFVSSVSSTFEQATPGAPRPRSLSFVHLFADSITGDSALSRSNSGVIGDYMAGGVAIAPRGDSATGRRVAVAPLPANDELAILDANTGDPIKFVALGVEPIAAAISADGRTAYVTMLGGRKPMGKDRASFQCCDPRAEAVRVDARGIASPGSVTRVDLVNGAATRDITVGRHPTAIAWDEAAGRLYVADGNSDTVHVIDTRGDSVIARIPIAPFRQRNIGLAPTALALSPDAKTLYVALGGVNAVAVYDVSSVFRPPSSSLLRGMIPTGWYPASLDVSADGKYLAIGALLGVGSGEGRTGGSPGKTGRYVHAVRGTVNVVPIPSATELGAYTMAVAENNRMPLASATQSAEHSAQSAKPRAIPERPGDPSLIQHVVYVVKENRTFDQVFGDLVRGDRDSSLVIYGRDVTPNAHALAERYVTLDRIFASGGNSADGHNWLTQANETEYPMWPLYFGRSYPAGAEDPLAYSSGGFIWEAAQAKKKTVAIFGEYAPNPKTNSSALRRATLAQWQERPKDYEWAHQLLAKRYNTRSDIPSLDRALVRDYPGWTMEVPDVIKAGDILWHLKGWESAGAMPNLTMIILPSNHTSGTSAGWCTPKSCVADNDLALGMIVEGLTHSRFWKDMAILVIEDDAQNGVDHVDGHRMPAHVISPYARRGVVDSTFYNQPSVVKTIELMLGLPSMSIYDLVASDMRASFIEPGEAPDLAPFTALEPRQPLSDVNQRVADITGPDAAARRRAAQQSARMSFDGPDEAPSDALNRILWHDARGWDKPYPDVKQSVFFPMSVYVEDEERPLKRPKQR